VLALEEDHRAADLSPADLTMLDFAEKLTLAPGTMTRVDVERLRGHGFDDAAIHDIVQVVALFGYYNRLADGLGIDPESPSTPRPATSASNEPRSLTDDGRSG
jgi:uncharacterized peroxidase-related enzyme